MAASDERGVPPWLRNGAAVIVLGVFLIDWLVALTAGKEPNSGILSPLMAVLGGIYGYDLVAKVKDRDGGGKP